MYLFAKLHIYFENNFGEFLIGISLESTDDVAVGIPQSGKVKQFYVYHLVIYLYFNKFFFTVEHST
jgi:hypothetical protein